MNTTTNDLAREAALSLRQRSLPYLATAVEQLADEHDRQRQVIAAIDERAGSALRSHGSFSGALREIQEQAQTALAGHDTKGTDR